ncbi:MAG: hydrogenase iron-sulfur subunit [SAR324 cluster bacterium]|nr:hydrogenase iron-sulfur subunit [SAR324 cluster bacterium]
MTPSPQKQTSSSSLYQKWHVIWHRLFMMLESQWNRLFSEKNNPFYFLGPLTLFALIILSVTGVYMFLYYSPSVESVYESVRYVNDEAFMGNLVRSVHQYAADMMLVLAVLHMVRIFVQDKYRQYRWIAWVSGVVLLFFIVLEGVTGHMMIGDTRSQFVSFNTSRLLAALKVFGPDLPRSFSSIELLGTWIIWIMLAVHILIPIGFIFLLYIHVMRISRPSLMPPSSLMLGLVLFLIGFSLLFPVALGEKLNFMALPHIENVDWFYLFFTPIIEHTSPYLILGSTLLVFIFLALAPWYRKPTPIDVARVDLEHCTGCATCSKDCPYEAIYMRPRTDGQKYKLESVIIEDRCSGCGNCVGSCNYHSMNLTTMTLESLEQTLTNALQRPLQDGSAPYLGVFCQNSVDALEQDSMTLKGETRLRILSVPCAGAIGPAFIHNAFDKGAAGIIIAACRPHDCYYKEGNLWLEQRLQGKRLPKLRLKHEQKPVLSLGFNKLEYSEFFKQAQSHLDLWTQNKIPKNNRGVFLPLKMRGKPLAGLVVAMISIIFVSVFAIGVLDPWKWNMYELPETDALLRINFFHLSDIVSCDMNNLETGSNEIRSRINQMTRKDNVSEKGQTQAISSHLVSALLCPRERVPVRLVAVLNGKQVLDHEFQPAGINKDGLTYVNLDLPVPSGDHQLTLQMNDSLNPERQAGIHFETSVSLKSRQILFVDYHEEQEKFFFRTR